MTNKAKALLIAAALALPASAQITDGTSTLDHVNYTTPMWSLSDPFAFAVTTNNSLRLSVLEYAFPAATNSLSQALAGESAARIAGTNALAQAMASGFSEERLMTIAGTNALAQAMASGFSEERLMTIAGTNALAQAMASGFSEERLMTIAGTNALFQSFTASLAAEAAARGAGTNLIWISLTPTIYASLYASNRADSAYSIASDAYGQATNASAQAFSVYAISTNAAAVAASASSAASSAGNLASLAYGLASSTYAAATSATAAAGAAYDLAESAFDAANAGADPYALYSRPLASEYSGYIDLSFADPSAPSGRVYSVYAPTSSFYTVNLPNVTNALGNPLAWNGQVTVNLDPGDLPFPFVYPPPNGYTAMTFTASGIPGNLTLSAITNGANVDLFYSVSLHATPLAYTNLTPLQYTGSVTVALEPLDQAFTGQVSFTPVERAPATTNLAGVLATKADVDGAVAALSQWVSYVSALNGALFLYEDPTSYAGFGLFTSYIAHTNNAANPHSVTAGQVGAVTPADLAAATNALAGLIVTTDPFIVRDSTDTNRWWRFEGTQAVQYALGAVTTNYTVTLSTNFKETAGGMHPEWTTTNWPFTDGDWRGSGDDNGLILDFSGYSTIWSAVPETYPVILYAGPGGDGTATVYQHIYYPTNATGNVLGPIPTNIVTYAQLLAWWVETEAQIAASNALPYTAWTGTVTPADGTATVTIAHGNMPVLVTSAPCVLTLDPTGYGTAGVSRVSLSYYPGTNSFTFATNIIDYAETPTVDTNGWNTLLIRRVSNGAWKGVGL